MAFQSGTINPATTTPAADISKIKNDLSVLRGVLQGTDDSDVARKLVAFTSSTGSAVVPVGTTAQRDGSPLAGYFRYNTTTTRFEGYNGTVWASIAGSGGATGGGNDKIFVQNSKYMTTSYTLGQDGLLAATVSIASPAVVTQANTYVGGEEVFFQTTGALPTGLAVNTTYYVSATGLSTSSFQISATRGGASINTSGSQSGTHTCGPAVSATMKGPLTIASSRSLTIPTGQSLAVL